MNNIKLLIENKLQNVAEVKGFEDVVRGESLYKNLPLAIYYLDYSNREIVPDNLDNYQERLLSSDYYKNSGSLQWNYYLVFIRNEINEDLKREIEQNDIYSRKYVLSRNELESFFEYKKSESEIKTDIVIRWKEMLSRASLKDVFTKKNYKDSVDDFLFGDKNDIDIDYKDTTDQHAKTKIEIVNNLQLEPSFRRYPIKRRFSFSKVNLIYGINGSGKTSILDALELVICGKSARYYELSEQPRSIKMSYNTKSEDVYTPKDYRKYRERDNFWYKNSYVQGNNLQLGFNRYNYFNEEAGFKIKETQVYDYKEKFESLALGYEFSYIIERLKGFRKRFQDKKREYDNKFKDERLIISESKKQIEQLKKGFADPDKLLGELQSLLTEIRWNEKAYIKIKTDYSSLESSLSKAKSILTDILKIDINIDSNNYQTWNSRIGYLEKLIRQVEVNREQIEKIEKELVKKDKEKDLIKEVLGLLNRFNEYFITEEVKKIIGLDKRLKNKTSEYGFLNDIKEKASKVNWVKIGDEEKSLKEKLEFHSKTIEETEKIINEKKSNLKSVKRNLDRLTEVITEIKLLGKEYLKIQTDTKECPLCGAIYDNSELIEKIEFVKKEIKDNGEIELLSNQIKELQSILDKHESEYSELEKLENIARFYYKNENFKNQSLKLIIKDIKKVGESLVSLKKEIEKENNLKSQLNILGFSEKQLLSIEEDLINNYGYSSKELRENELKKTISEAENIYKQILSEIKQNDLKKNELNEIISGIIKKYNEEISISDRIKSIKNELRDLKKGISYMNELKSHINYSEDNELSLISLKINQVDELFERYKENKTQSEHFDFLDRSISKSRIRINKEIEPVLKKLEEGLDVIEKILKEDDRDKLLKEFFDDNDQQIQEIFQKIHSPREFSNVKFFKSDQDIILERSNGEYSNINEISSGQRTALALSIFFALNKKLKNGPNLLMFDDPVTYVDDMNILVFLDYLRELVIKENRQLFFATANMKLANFFEKKFDFLRSRNEFNNIILER